MNERELRFRPQPRPVVGYLALGAGLAGIFTYGLVFVPLALIFSLAALFRG
jgi:hypothetical protein